MFESLNKKVPILLNKPKSKQHQRKNNKTTSWTPYGASWSRASCVWKRQLLAAPGNYQPSTINPWLVAGWTNQFPKMIIVKLGWFFFQVSWWEFNKLFWLFWNHPCRLFLGWWIFFCWEVGRWWRCWFFELNPPMDLYYRDMNKTCIVYTNCLSFLYFMLTCIES